MLHQLIDISDATPVELIEAKIVMGFENCKPISEIAADIAALLEDQKTEQS